MILFLAAIVWTVPASAKKKKAAKKKSVTKLINQKYTTKASVAERKAKPMKSGKKTFKVGKSGCGFVKFTAPRNGKYTFTVSGLKRNKRRSLPGKHYWFRLMTVNPVNPRALVLNNVKTNGGKTMNLYFWWKSIHKGSMKYRYLKKRYGKIRLTAGQTVYVFFCANSQDSFKLKIKRAKGK
jgi:hypothetical protein